jgi:hypothetical protein
MRSRARVGKVGFPHRVPIGAALLKPYRRSIVATLLVSAR